MKMEPYKIHAEILVRPDTHKLAGDHPGELCQALEILYVCDPTRNTECSKENCGNPCRMTRKAEYAKRFDINDDIIIP